VPASGSWQRLDVLLRDLGEGGDPIVTDLELAHVDGQVWFDRIGRMADCVAPAAGQPTVPTDEDVLIDDDAPSWVTFENGSNGPLRWSTAQAASGSLSLVHPYRGEGTYVTGIANLAQPLVAGSKLSLYALVDSCSPPVRQIHLRITTSAGSGTVSWGEPVWDVEPSTLDRGPVPTSGSWTRLEVPLDALALDSGTLTRLDIAHVDGRVWFDRIAFWPLTRAQLTSFVSDHESTVSVGTTVTWTATATGTVQPLQYRFERRDDLGNWSIVQNYGMQNAYTWTPTVADVGTNAVRVSVRNAGSTADFEDTATLLVRVVAGGEGLWLRNPDIRFAWWKRWFEPRVPVSLGVHYGSLTTTSEGAARRHSLYTPELQLLAETEITTAPSPAIAYEYIWFAGQPLAQVTTATAAIDWYFNDHLDTPILQTNSDGDLAWRAEYDPYGTAFSVRTGIDKHQPLRFPGQEDAGGEELAYNIFRWYRAGWGRYTQGDPLTVGSLFAGNVLAQYNGMYPDHELRHRMYLPQFDQAFGYGAYNPLGVIDRNGLSAAGTLGKLCTSIPHPLAKALGWAIVAVAAYNAIDNALDQTTKCNYCPTKKCLPCDPPLGTLSYRTDSAPHAGMTGLHIHIYEMHQSPPFAGCKCFWHEVGHPYQPPVPPPGAIPIRPAGGGGVG
jgi:RHS repeat-associated protein